MQVIHMIGHMRLGAGRYIVDTCLQQASRHGHDVRVLVSPDFEGNWKTDTKLASELENAGIPVLCGGDFFHRDLSGLLKAASYINGLIGPALGRSIVHAHSAIAAAVARWAGARRIVATCHGFDLTRSAICNIQDALAFRQCNAITTPSDYWADFLVSEMRLPRPLVIPVGLNMNQYPFLRRRSRKKGDPLRIVTACELTYRKGVDLLIEAMRDVWRQYPETELHILGEGDAETELRQRSSGLGKSSQQVFFNGFIDDLYPILGSYDLFVLASRSDNSPVSIIEAMLAGLPVVATSVGGIPEMILGSRGGALAEPHSASSLAETIVGLLCLGKQTLDEMSARAQSYARSRFAIEKTVSDIEEVYVSIGVDEDPLHEAAASEAVVCLKKHLRSSGENGSAKQHCKLSKEAIHV